MVNYAQPDLTRHPPRSPRIRLGDDGPSDDQVAGTSGERFLGRQRSTLVAPRIGAAPDSGRHDREGRTARVADGSDFVRRGDHAIESGGLRQCREPFHLVGHLAGHPHVGERRPVEAREHRHADHERRRPPHPRRLFSGRADCRLHHGGTT